jgi:hypothetical protein
MINFKKLRQMIEITGNGNIVSKEIQVSTFLRLHLGCKGVIELHQGEEEKVSIEADENLIDFFSATNAGKTLYVSTEGNLRRPVFTKCVIKVFLRQMNLLYVRNDKGNVVCPAPLVLNQPLEVKIQSEGDTELNVVVPALKVLSQTQGNIVLKGSCTKLEITNQGQGDFDASELIAQELSIKNMAQGNVYLNATDSIKISHFGDGNIHYSGTAEVKDVNQFGSGEIKYVQGKVAL